jgi:hypothetical protein
VPKCGTACKGIKLTDDEDKIEMREGRSTLVLRRIHEEGRTPQKANLGEYAAKPPDSS